ncbi:hypothetical protein BU14_0031s0027 [Porphyra umbilicalis]|uniref:Uncharacterized protein n=1 Tax=Porphyra umbilicalis TaxID=2786 RepID=A0A1X6PJ65_PORUM|nr:hypothetical protein BU14_0031s0027 [Porphyra umbilicalis]|eukprot:OSX80855.1 hypothetical protein BU14_0031s0027 [Porphyra umbilicalis]
MCVDAKRRAAGKGFSDLRWVHSHARRRAPCGHPTSGGSDSARLSPAAAALGCDRQCCWRGGVVIPAAATARTTAAAAVAAAAVGAAASAAAAAAAQATAGATATAKAAAVATRPGGAPPPAAGNHRRGLPASRWVAARCPTRPRRPRAREPPPPPAARPPAVPQSRHPQDVSLRRFQPHVPRHAVEVWSERGRDPRRSRADPHRLHRRAGRVDEPRRRQCGRHPLRLRARAHAHPRRRRWVPPKRPPVGGGGGPRARPPLRVRRRGDNDAAAATCDAVKLHHLPRQSGKVTTPNADAATLTAVARSGSVVPSATAVAAWHLYAGRVPRLLR